MAVRYEWVDRLWGSIGQVDLTIDPTPIESGLWGQAFRAIYLPWQMPTIVRFVRDEPDIQTAQTVLTLLARGFRLPGLPIYINSQQPQVIVREHVESLSIRERCAIERSIGHALRTLEAEGALHSSAHGRGRQKHRDTYIETTRALDGTLPDAAEALRVLANEAKAFISSLSMENVGRASGRLVIYDFRTYLR